MDLKKELRELQHRFAQTDLLTRPSRGSGYIEYLVLRYQNICIRIDGNPNHKRPHFHVDYGKMRHAASYAIDTGELLAGDLDRKYDRDVRRWIEENRERLLEAWTLTQAGAKPETVIAELKGSEFGQ